MAIAIGIKAVIQGYSVYFSTVNDMLDDLFMSRADNSYYQKLRKYAQVDLLILDELGLKKLNQTSVVINGESYRMREREGTLPKTGAGQRGRPRKQAATETSDEREVGSFKSLQVGDFLRQKWGIFIDINTAGNLSLLVPEMDSIADPVISNTEEAAETLNTESAMNEEEIKRRRSIPHEQSTIQPQEAHKSPIGINVSALLPNAFRHLASYQLARLKKTRKAEGSRERGTNNSQQEQTDEGAESRLRTDEKGSIEQSFRGE